MLPPHQVSSRQETNCPSYLKFRNSVEGKHLRKSEVREDREDLPLPKPVSSATAKVVMDVLARVPVPLV